MAEGKFTLDKVRLSRLFGPRESNSEADQKHVQRSHDLAVAITQAGHRVAEQRKRDGGHELRDHHMRNGSDLKDRVEPFCRQRGLGHRQQRHDKARVELAQNISLHVHHIRPASIDVA